MRYFLSLIIMACLAFFSACSHKMLPTKDAPATAAKTLLMERDSLLLPRGETRGRVMVAAGKRVNYKDGVYVLQSDLALMKRYGYHQQSAPDNALKAKAEQLIAKGTTTDVGTFSYTQLPLAKIKYYYLGKFRMDIPTFYYSNDGERRHEQGYSANIAVPVFVVTDME